MLKSRTIPFLLLATVVQTIDSVLDLFLGSTGDRLSLRPPKKSFKKSPDENNIGVASVKIGF